MVLPAPVGPTMAIGLTGPHVEREVLDEWTFRDVPERHVVELDVTAHIAERRRVDGVGSFLGGVEQFEDPFGRSDPRLQHVHHRGDLGERLGELARVLHEGLHVAERQGPRRHAQSTDDGDRHVVEVPDEHRRRHDQPGDELGAEAGFVELLVLDIEALLDLALAAEHLDQRVPAEGLLDLSVESAGVRPLGDELALRALGDLAGDEQHQRDGQQRQRREQR